MQPHQERQQDTSLLPRRPSVSPASCHRRLRAPVRPDGYHDRGSVGGFQQKPRSGDQHERSTLPLDIWAYCDTHAHCRLLGPSRIPVQGRGALAPSFKRLACWRANTAPRLPLLNQTKGLLQGHEESRLVCCMHSGDLVGDQLTCRFLDRSHHTFTYRNRRDHLDDNHEHLC